MMLTARTVALDGIAVTITVPNRPALATCLACSRDLYPTPRRSLGIWTVAWDDTEGERVCAAAPWGGPHTASRQRPDLAGALKRG